jgi:3'(2'), 5'-bisphosphate nucleotidase
LADAFPGDALVAEEDSTALRLPEHEPILASIVAALQRAEPSLNGDRVIRAVDRGGGSPGERYWALDPVDGTKGFVRGDQYAVALALIVGGQVQIGILGCPRLSLGTGDGSLVFAVRGHGAHRMPLSGEEVTPLHVSSCGDARLASVLRSVEDTHIDVDAVNEVLRRLAVAGPPTRMDSQAKHALVAAGKGELIVRLPPAAHDRDWVWDQAAGSIIVEEAGGKVTDARGLELDFSAGRTLARNQGVAVSNGHLHVALLDALRFLEGRSFASGAP